MSFHYELRFSAIGGQGIITAGTLLAESVVEYKNLYAIHSPRYTAQVRGGPTKVDVIIDEKPIYFPKTTDVDFYLSTSQRSFEAYFQDIKEGAIIVLDSNLVGEFNDPKYRIYRIPIIETAAKEIGNIVTVSTLSLAITAKLTGLITLEELEDFIPKKVPKGFEEINLKAVRVGYNIV
ncbi:MAG: 2-oxoacid:acceptor oxidoreductase family protein [Candidatus Aminicenantes bacterium]|nr:2-oxoacid:acceptor oxidoreductase family protein [Candidatus Aminicenantes bacterium]